MQRQDQRRVLGDHQGLGRDFHALAAQLLDLGDQRPGVEHHAVADDAELARPHDPRRQQRQLVDGAVDDQRVPGVVPALEAGDDVGALGEPVDDLALALVPPLGADHHHVAHARPPSGGRRPRPPGLTWPAGRAQPFRAVVLAGAIRLSARREEPGLTDKSPPPRASLLTPLENPTFRAIWIATLGSNFGGLIQAVGAAWMMTSITASESMVALVQASVTLPIMVFSLASGAVADNFNRRQVMLVAQLFMLAVSVGLALAAWANLLSPWALLAFTFLIGCGTALNNPSWQASVADIVERPHVPAAVALNSVGFNLTRSVGPAVGGAIVAAAGAAAAFAVNALSYLGLIWVLVRWRPAIPVSTLPREDLGAAMGAGLRYVAMSPNLLTVMLRAFLFGLTSVAVMALLPLVARAHGRRRAAHLRRAARGVRGRRDRRRLPRHPAARDAVERVDRAARLRRLRGLRRAAGGRRPRRGGGGRHPDRRRRLGAGAGALQHHGPALGAALGARPGAGALPDRRLRRHGARQLALGRRRRGARPRAGAARRRRRDAPRRPRRPPAAACPTAPTSTSIR